MRSDIMNRPIEDLLRIVKTGGGIMVDGTKPGEELLRLAKAASTGTTNIVMAESEYKTAEDLVRIAEASGGKVIFQ